MRLPNGYRGVVKLSGKEENHLQQDSLQDEKLTKRQEKLSNNIKYLTTLKQELVLYRYLPNIMIIQSTYQL